MDNEKLSNYIGGGFWQCHKDWVKVLGIEKTLWITHLFDWRRYLVNYKKIEENGFFYLSQNRIFEETMINEKKQTIYIDFFKEIGVLEVKRQGIPCKNFYRVNAEKLIEFVENQLGENRGSSSAKFPELDQQIRRSILNNNLSNNNSNKISLLLSKDNKEILLDQIPEESGEVNVPAPQKVGTSTSSDINSDINTDIQSDINISQASNTRHPVRIAQDIKKEKLLSQEPPAPKILRISSDIESIIEYWAEMKLHPTRTNTKSYIANIQKIRKLLNGTLLNKKFTPDDIKASIRNFSIAAFDEEYEPSNPIYKKQLQKTSIGDFILSEFTKGEKYLFKKYMDPPQLSKRLLNDPMPYYTENLKDLYRKEILGNAYIDKWSTQQENTFRYSSQKIKQFEENNYGKFINRPGQPEWAELLMSAILKDCSDTSKINLGWLASDDTFNRRLPAYLNSQGYFVFNHDSGGGCVEQARIFSEQAKKREEEKEKRLEGDQWGDGPDYEEDDNVTIDNGGDVRLDLYD